MNWSPEEVAFLRECTAMGLNSVQVSPILERRPSAISYMRQCCGFRLPQKPKAPINPRPAAPIHEIQQVVADRFEISLHDLLSNRRSPKEAWPRQYAMLLAKELTPQSYPAIGRRFNRDHTTVIHGVKAAQKRIANNAELAQTIKQIREHFLAKNPVDSELEVSFLAEAESA